MIVVAANGPTASNTTTRINENAGSFLISTSTTFIETHSSLAYIPPISRLVRNNVLTFASGGWIPE